jgi:hypothetical protein
MPRVRVEFLIDPTGWERREKAALIKTLKTTVFLRDLCAPALKKDHRGYPIIRAKPLNIFEKNREQNSCF